MDRVYKLTEVKNGKSVAFKEISGMKVDLHRRLIEMGFVKGTKIEVVKNEKKRKLMLVCVRGYLLSLDYFISDCVFVWGNENE